MKPEDLPFDELLPAEPSSRQAEIAFARGPGGATYVARQRVGYPFHLGKALSTPGDPVGMPTVYLQSCSGGIFEGDDLQVQLTAGEGAAAHVTSAASTIVHSMETVGARQAVEIRAQAGTILEYLPDPTILFPRSRFESRVHVHMHRDATVILGDALILHDPDGGSEVFDRFESETRIHDDSGRLLACDRFRIAGADLARRMPGITGSFTAQGTLFALTATQPATVLVTAMRDALAGIMDVYVGASALPNASGAWMRLLARDAVGLRAGLQLAWIALRREITGTVPAPRRK